MPVWVVGSLSVLLRWVVAGVFLFAAVPKLLEPGPFAESIVNYQLVGGTLAGLAAVTVPMIEFVLAVALITGFMIRGAALATFVMLGAFALAIAQAVLRDINIDCGCFGSAAEAGTSWTGVVRNVLLMAACALIYVLPHHWPLPARKPAAPSEA